MNRSPEWFITLEMEPVFNRSLKSNNGDEARALEWDGKSDIFLRRVIKNV